MPNCEFTDGMKRLLRGHPALPADRTRELATQFNGAQEKVCRHLAALEYPLDRVAQELKAGHLPYFREGSDQDRKHNLGKKSSYRFAGFAPSHIDEFDSKVADRRNHPLGAAEFEAWQVLFLMGFTFDIIEQVAMRAFPATGDAGAVRAQLAEALSEARKIRDEILLGNLLLVAKIVMKRGCFRSSVVVDDLFTAGMDGLMISISRYDPSVGQFSTYATPWITMAIDRFVAKTRNVIRIPIGMQDKVRRQRNQAESAGANRADAVPLIPEVQSLEDPIPGFADSELRLEDVVADPLAVQPHDALERADIASILRDRMLQMDDLKQFILAMRNDIGDAVTIAANLFRNETALSMSRGRAIATAASKSLDEPARIRMIGVLVAAPEPCPEAVEAPEPVELELAV
jgi:RNA polymerase sigma factor (sigma-70 family)